MSTYKKPKYSFHDGVLRFDEKFNEPLDPYHKIMSQATVIFFGTYFNQNLTVPPNVRRLIMGDNFNMPLILPQFIETLIFCDKFNQLLHLTPHIVHLELGCYFNKPLVIRSKMKLLCVGSQFNQKIELEPNATVQQLKIGCVYAQQRIISNPNIKCINIDWFCHEPLDLKIIKNSSVIHCRIFHDVSLELTKNILDLCICEGVHQTLVLNKNIQRLKIDCCFEGPLFLTKKLRYVSFYSYAAPKIMLPKHLIFLEQYDGCINSSKLSKNIKQCILGTVILNDVFMECCVEKLTICAEYVQGKIIYIDNLSDNIKVLILHCSLHSHDLKHLLPTYNLPRKHLNKTWIE